MTKKDYITYWKDTAEKDWIAVGNMFEAGDYVHGLFFAHLVLEKLCKAHWIKKHQSNHPPRIHNLIYLVDNAPLKVTPPQRVILEKMNSFQLEGRYPDYKNSLYKMCDKKFTKEILKQVDTVRQWLLQTL